MSAITHQMMINHHAPAVFGGFAERLRLWRRRAQQRAELAKWTERDLHDVGLSWSQVAEEIDKPFWRA